MSVPLLYLSSPSELIVQPLRQCQPAETQITNLGAFFALTAPTLISPARIMSLLSRLGAIGRPCLLPTGIESAPCRPLECNATSTAAPAAYPPGRNRPALVARCAALGGP